MSKLLTRIATNFSTYHLRTPLDIRLFKQEEQLAKVRRSLEARFRDPGIAGHVAQMLRGYRTSLYELERVNKELNQLQKDVKDIIKSSSKSQKQPSIEQTKKQKLHQITQLKHHQKQKQTNIKNQLKKIQQQISKIGNLVDPNTPISKDQKDNVVLKQYKPESGLLEHAVSYSELCESFGITDLRRGQKVGGHRGYFLRGSGVRLALGLANYGMDFLENKGYELYHSPAIISQSTLKGSCQLKSIQQDVYKLQGLDSYLIATSEQTLAGYYKDQVIQRPNLPIRMAGYSTCFRKEAGAHGKDIHGLFRVHQFEKVEQFAIVEGEASSEEMKRMMGVSEEFYQSLGIPYRVVDIVSGELNDAAACKYDLEAWFPSQKRYRQLVSVSNCTQYQSRLLKVQFQGANNQLKYPHMLNGTLVAIQRALTCIIENNYNQKQNYISIPKILQKYVGFDRITRKSEQK